LIVHAKEKEQGEATFYRPLIDGGSRDYIVQEADLVGFLYMGGKERILDFNPSESWYGKNPAQWPAFTLPPAEQARTLMSNLFAEAKAAIGKQSESSAALA